MSGGGREYDGKSMGGFVIVTGGGWCMCECHHHPCCSVCGKNIKGKKNEKRGLMREK